MTANIPGARLREVEQRLTQLRGEQAIDEFIAEHPNETKVLEQMVAARRAGKPMPSLARVQRVMLWSDGEVEFKTDPVPEGRERNERGGRGLTGAGAGGRDRGPRRGPGGTSGPGGAGGQGGSSALGGGPRPGGFSGPRGGGSFSGGPPRGGGARPGGPPRPGGRGPARGRGRPGDGAGRAGQGMPRSGEGWVLLREGEKPPEPEPLPEYDWDEEETPPQQESQTPAEGSAGAENSTSS